jgi:hypothetical protein
MKRKHTSIMFFIAILALTAQLSFISPTASAQNTNSSTTMQNGNMGIPYNRGCRRRCDKAYRRCLRSSKNPRACRVHYRNCLRRCAQ